MTFITGEGPGEWAETRGVLLRSDGGLSIVSDAPEKLIFFDSSFRLLREMRFDKSQNWLRVFSAYPRGGLIISSESDFSKASDGVHLLTVKLKHFDEQGKVSESGLEFRHRVAQKVRRYEGGVGISINMVDPFFFGYMEKRERLLVTDHESYRLRMVDVKNRQLIGTFTRAYVRQPWFKDPDDKRKPAFSDPEFFMDISAIVPCRDCFWVFTSLLNPAKGVCVDVVGVDGDYRDRFWLPLPGLTRPDSVGNSRLCVTGDRIAWVYSDEDDNPVISLFSY